ncbi:MAG TPA: ABC transporter substrate-binding protein [Candidatus Lustribacter sp.]|nr:ABC transporter substrate-binding protein [Candidatus Lustribacter sp.]
MTHPLTRRTSLAAIAAIGAGTLLPRVARGDAAPLRVALVPIFDVVPYYAADAQGFFAEENVAPAAQVVRGGAAAIPAVVGGTYDMVYANGTSIVQAINRGIELRIVLEGAPMGSKPPDPGALLKRKGEPLKTGKDLEGKVVGVNALRDVQWMLVTSWIKATGGDPDKVQLVEVPLPSMIDTIKAKRVDTALVLDPFLAMGLADPEIELLDWAMSRVYPGGPIAFWALTPQLAATRANDVRAFARAYKRGAAWCNAPANKEALIKLVADYTKIPPDVVARMSPVPAHAEIEPAGLPRLTTMMKQSGLLTGDVDLRTKIFS